MDTSNKTRWTDENSYAEDIAKDKANVRIPPPVISLAGIGIGVAIQFFVAPLTVTGLWPALRICCGVFVGLVGFAAIILGLIHFKRTGQKPEPWSSTPAIIYEGIYRYSRNPMYVGLALIQGGIGIGTGIFWITVMVLPVLIAIHNLIVLREEEYLQRKFGEEYLKYMSSVRRWV